MSLLTSRIGWHYQMVFSEKEIPTNIWEVIKRNEGCDWCWLVETTMAVFIVQL